MSTTWRCSKITIDIVEIKTAAEIEARMMKANAVVFRCRRKRVRIEAHRSNT